MTELQLVTRDEFAKARALIQQSTELLDLRTNARSLVESAEAISGLSRQRTAAATRRRPRPWNPQDVLDLRTVKRDRTNLLGDQFSEKIPLANLADRSLSLGQDISLNSGWKVPTGPDGPMTKFWTALCNDASLTWDQRKARYHEKLFAEQDILFNPPLGAHVWSDLELAGANWYAHTVEPWIADELKTDWLNRSYQHDGTVHERCWFHHSGGYYCDGHAVYLDMHGDYTCTDSLFDELGGNAIQLTNREDEWKYAPKNGQPFWYPKVSQRKAAGGTIKLQRLVIGETGYSDGRGSFPISLLGLGRPGRPFDVLITDFLISCAWAPGMHSKARSRGGVCVEGYLHNDHAYGTVVVRRGRIELWKPDRQPLAINNAQSVEVTECEFVCNEGSRYIDLDRNDFASFDDVRPCGEIRWKGNDGNVLVRVRDVVVGHCSEDMVIRDGKRVS